MANYTEYVENFLKAADIISQSTVNKLEYDKTIIAEITDNGNAVRGQYTVKSGGTLFSAYAENSDYDIGDQVYVSIPNGDYSNQKMIVGRYVGTGNSSYYKYSSPWKKFVDVTGDILEDSSVDDSKKSILANGSIEEKVIWQTSNIESGDGYTAIGLRSGFKTNLSSIGAAYGTFGLRLYVLYYNPNTTNNTPRSVMFELTNNDMYGDPYNFETFYNQTKLFDISGLGTIIGLKLTLFQGSNFYTSDKQFVPFTETKNKRQYNIVTKESSIVSYQETLKDNIIVDNIYVALGYNLEDFEGDQVLLFTNNTKVFGSTEKEKTLQVRWIHKDPETNEVSCFNTIDSLTESAKVHWYKYNMNKGINDRWAGDYWQEIESLEDHFKATIDLDVTKQQETFKVIIETPLYDTLILSAASNDENVEDLSIKLENAKKLYESSADNFAAIASPSNYNKYVQAKAYYEQAKKDFEAAAAIYTSDLKLLESNQVVFENENKVVDQTTLDAIQGLSIVCDKEGYQGIYYLYDTTNNILNKNEASQQRILTVCYNSLTDENILDSAEEIIWKFPVSNTMIQTPMAGVEYREDDSFSQTKDGYYEISRTADNTGSLSINGYTGIQQNQVFRIKDYYSANATNNIITCVVKHGENLYSASVDLSFGPKGTNGTDYTFLIKMAPGRSCLYKQDPKGIVMDPLEIRASLLDYNNLFLEDFNGNSITYDWYSYDIIPKVGFCDEEGNLYVKKTLRGKETFEKSNGCQVPDSTINYTLSLIKNKTITSEDKFFIRHLTPKEIVYYSSTQYITSSLSDEDKQKITEWMNDFFSEDGTPKDSTPYYYILHAKVENESTSSGVNLGKVILDAYLPIPFSTNIDAYNHIEGSERIVYGTTGVCNYYYKDKYILFDKDNNENKDSKWEILSDVDEIGFIPQITADGYLIPPSQYLNGITEKVSVLSKVNDELAWVQPILLYKEVYTSALLNSWDQSLSIDESKGAILSTMLGAGYKDSQNRYNGVLIGDVKSTADGNAETGIYGYNAGEQSFGLNIDGTAFFGKSGRGRIEMDGNSGTIKSMSYGTNSSGMMIDLDDGHIDILGNKLVYKIEPEDALEEGIAEEQSFKEKCEILLNKYKDLKEAQNQIAVDAWKYYTQSTEDIYNSAQEKINKYNIIIDILNIIIEGYFLYNTYRRNYLYYFKDKNNQYQLIDTISKENFETIVKSKKNLYIQIDNTSYESIAANYDFLSYVNSKSITLSEIFISDEVITNTEYEYSTTGSQVWISAQSPYFLIKSGYNANNQELIKISNDELFIQTDNYTETEWDENGEVVSGKEGSGLKFDLQEGSFLAHNFGMLSVYNDATNPRYNGSYFKLSDTGNPYFQVHYKDSQTNQEHDLIKISYNELIMESPNWYYDSENASLSSGMQINLTDGTIRSFNGFDLFAQNNCSDKNSVNLYAHRGSFVQLSSSGMPYFKIHYSLETMDNYIKLDEDENHDLILNNIDLTNFSYNENKSILSSGGKGFLTNDLLNISYSDFILRSANFGYALKSTISDKTTVAPVGTQVNLKSGNITSFNFNLLSYSPDMTGLICIDSSAPQDVGTSNRYPFLIQGGLKSSSLYNYVSVSRKCLTNYSYNLKAPYISYDYKLIDGYKKTSDKSRVTNLSYLDASVEGMKVLVSLNLQTLKGVYQEFIKEKNTETNNLSDKLITEYSFNINKNNTTPKSTSAENSVIYEEKVYPKIIIKQKAIPKTETYYKKDESGNLTDTLKDEQDERSKISYQFENILEKNISILKGFGSNSEKIYSVIINDTIKIDCSSSFYKYSDNEYTEKIPLGNLCEGLEITYDGNSYTRKTRLFTCGFSYFCKKFESSTFFYSSFGDSANDTDSNTIVTNIHNSILNSLKKINLDGSSDYKEDFNTQNIKPLVDEKGLLLSYSEAKKQLYIYKGSGSDTSTETTITTTPSKFAVGWDGHVIMEHITATVGGKIGPFTINENSLYTQDSSLGGNGIYLGDDGFSLKKGSNGIQTMPNGNLYLSGDIYIGGTIYGENWTLHGYYTSSGGTQSGSRSSSSIAGWTINTSQLSSKAKTEGVSNVYLDPNGTIALNGKNVFLDGPNKKFTIGDGFTIYGLATSGIISGANGLSFYVGSDHIAMMKDSLLFYYPKINLGGISTATISVGGATLTAGIGSVLASFSATGITSGTGTNQIKLDGLNGTLTCKKIKCGTNDAGALGKLAYCDKVVLSGNFRLGSNTTWESFTLTPTTSDSSIATGSITVSGGSTSTNVYILIYNDLYEGFTTSSTVAASHAGKGTGYRYVQETVKGNSSDTTVNIKITSTATTNTTAT